MAKLERVKREVVKRFVKGESMEDIQASYKDIDLDLSQIATWVRERVCLFRKDLSKKDLRYLVRQYEKGCSGRALAKEYGMSPNTIVQILRDAGVKIRKYHFRVPQKVREEAVRRYEAGESTKDLAQEYGVSWPTIGNWVRRAGGEIRRTGRPPYAKEFRESVAKRYEAGETSTTIARDLGITPSTVLQWAREFKVDIRSQGPSKYSQDLVDEILRRRKKGENLSEIASKLKVDRSTLSRWLRKAGVKTNRRSKKKRKK